jgi:general secretion pathway protein N
MRQPRPLADPGLPALPRWRSARRRARDSRSFAPSRFDGLPLRRSGWRWAVAGLLAGGLLALLVHAPASWLAAALAQATDQRVLLADARGSVWSGSAVLLLGSGPGSRDASALPGRLRWTLGLARENRRQLELRLRHACCIDDQTRLWIDPGVKRLRLSMPPGAPEIGHWPAAWLAGLGAPFNTVRLGGLLRLKGEALALESVAGRWRVSGRAELQLLDLSSVLVPGGTLGSYRLVVNGTEGSGARLELQTVTGPLRMSGSGQWAESGLRFRGEARAEAGSEPMLNNLLNLLGQRRGAVAVLAIG